MATPQELEDALRNAHAAGDTAAAQQIADALVQARGAGTPAAPAAPATPEKPNTAYDMGASFAAGIPRGLIETIMLPVTADRLMRSGVDWAVGKADSGVRSVLGLQPRQPIAPQDQMPNPVNDVVYGAQDAVRKGMDATLYKPRTTPGKYAQTIGEFVGPGGFPSKSVRAAPTLARKAGEYTSDLVRTAVTPAIMSEGAGQATEGTAAEPFARFLGAILGVGAGAAVKSMSAPESVLRRSVGDPNAVDWERAMALQNNPTGIKLTGPEAVAQAQDGATALTNLQRVVEGSTEGRAATAPFFRERPAQIDAAVGNMLDTVGPQSTAPSQLGPQAVAAAERALQNAPEGRALTDAIFGTGPRTTPLQAGEVIQPDLHSVYARREGMRNALADVDYEAARRAAPTIPVEDLQPRNTVTRPGYTRLDPAENPITGQPEMRPTGVPPQIETPSMTSRTGPDLVQVDARPTVQLIDRLRADARLGTSQALDDVRGMLFREGGVDTSVRGLDSARGQISDMIGIAKRDGNMQTAEHLGQVLRSLDEQLQAVPAYRSATENFQAASAPLEPFRAPGAGAVVERNQTNTAFNMAPENVPQALSSPSELRNFLSVASPEARTAMENSIATKIMDSATDANGAVARDKLAIALRDNADVLEQIPAVRDRLAAVLPAAENAAAARVGPLADVANATDTAGASNAVLPKNPLVGGEKEAGEAVRRMAQEDPTATRSLVRQNLADRYNTAATSTQEGVKDFAGAKFNKDVAGNPARRRTLEEVITAADPSGSARDSVNTLLDVLEATGRRKPIGSATEFNRSVNTDLGTASPFGRGVQAARTLGASFLTTAGDTVTRATARRSIGTLADLFTDPRSVEMIREAVARGAPTVLPEALLESILLGNVAAQRQPGQPQAPKPVPAAKPQSRDARFNP